MPQQSNDDTRPIRLLWLPGIAIGSICALLVWPQTHRLVASQLRLAIPTNQSIAAASPTGFSDPSVSEYAWPIVRRSANEHPDDFTQQIAAAIILPPDLEKNSSNSTAAPAPIDSSYKLKRLQALIPRFEDNPSVYATVLRYSSMGKVRMTRIEASRFLPDSETLSAAQLAKIVHSSPADVEVFNTECEAAERLDLDNGYFPMMHAIGLFEAHRDAEALDAMDRAASCGHWTEYLNDEFEGEAALQTDAFGKPGPLTRSMFAAAILLPHLSSIRSAARFALYEAMEAEIAGRLVDGLRIRTDVRRIGALMRYDSTNLIGELVGMSLVKMSLLRTAGAPAGSKSDEFTQKEARETLLRGFDSYLASAGATSESESVHAEIDACVKTRAIITASLRSSVFNTDLYTVLGLSIVDMTVLSTIISLAMLGGLVCVLMAVAGLGPIKKLPRSGRVALISVLLLAAGSAAVWLVIQQATGSIGTIASLGQLWASSEDGTPPGHSPIQVIMDGYLGIIAVAPGIMVMVLTALCLTWRVPVVAGVARGIRGCTVPICSIITIGYVVLSPITAAYESRLDTRLTEAFTHEGRATARDIGTQWPGLAGLVR